MSTLESVYKWGLRGFILHGHVFLIVSKYNFKHFSGVAFNLQISRLICLPTSYHFKASLTSIFYLIT